MPIINPKKISPEILSKYTISNNTFRLVNVKNPTLDKYNKAPKDLIIAEIGDVKQQEFYPQIKLGRWGNSENDNEVNFSIRLKDTDYDTEWGYIIQKDGTDGTGIINFKTS